MAFVFHQHDEAGDDVEGGDHDNERQDQEHHVAFDLQRCEEAGVALAPVVKARVGAEQFSLTCALMASGRWGYRRRFRGSRRRLGAGKRFAGR